MNPQDWAGVRCRQSSVLAEGGCLISTAPAHESQVSDCMLATKPSWTEAHAGLHKKLHRLHEQTYFFPTVKTKVKTEQNHPDLSIPLLLYILKHRQMKEELDSNCIPHYLTLL